MSGRVASLRWGQPGDVGVEIRRPDQPAATESDAGYFPPSEQNSDAAIGNAQ